MTDKVIPVVIPFYKKEKELKACLSALKQQEGVTTEIFVRDNTNDNILYTRAVNEGLRKYAYDFKNEYILVLTQDAYLHKNALAELVKCLDTHPSAGIASPIQVDQTGTITWAGSLDAYPWGVHNGHVRHPTMPYTTFWAPGACILLRASMIREIGLLDESMLFICSDCDYSFTARARGFEVYVVPTAVCQHYVQASGEEASPAIAAVKYADQLCFSAKWLDGRTYRHLAREGTSLTPQRVAEETKNTLDALNSVKAPLQSWTQAGMVHKALAIFKKELKEAGA